MLTEQFLNLTCSVLSNDEAKFEDSTISSVNKVLSFYKEDTIPIHFRVKFHLAKTLCKLRLTGKNGSESVDSIIATGQFKEFDEFLQVLSTREFSKSDKESINSQINGRRKLVSLLKDAPQIEKFVEMFNNNSYTDIDEAIQDYELVLSKMYARFSEEKRNESNSRIETLDLSSDNYKHVLDQIEISYSGKNAITTGYNQLDEYLNGGFEPTRLYVFGGASGDGKSVLLCNMVKNAVDRKKSLDDLIDIYVYITMENLIDESLARIYCSKENKKLKKMMENFNSERHVIENNMKEWLLQNRSVVAMAYFPPTLTSSADIMAYVDELQNKYKDIGAIRGIYIDYLDLLRSGQTFDLHRLEMGQVTIDLKMMAVQMTVPVITVTQLNRSGYDQRESLSLVQMSESIKKVEHADFVAMLRAIDNEENQNNPDAIGGKLKIVIGKNRSGPKNKEVNLRTNFSTFRIEDTDQDKGEKFDVGVIPTDSIL